MSNPKLGSHAIVIGGSMAGVLAARALSDVFAKVTVIERDQYTDNTVPRKGVPQARHAHGLLTRGHDIMARFFPNLPQRLMEHGALKSDMGKMMMMYHFGGYKIPVESGMMGTVCTRGLLDLCVRRELEQVPNITFLAGRSVEGLIATGDNSRVIGVRLQRLEEGVPLEEVAADLVVDTSGRGSQSPKWLERMGYDRPEEITVKVNVGYATRLYTRSTPDEEAKVILIWSSAPEKRIGVAFPIEEQRWIISLGGMLGDYPPLDDEGFKAFARTLPAMEIADILESESAITEAIQHRFPSNFRRQYETLRRFPDGYLVMGDAICSFNPIYGQGMTTSALEAETLHQLVSAPNATLEGFALRYFRAITKHVDFAWQLATGEDFRHAEIEGKRPMGTGFLHKYVEWVHRTSQVDPAAHIAFLKVMNMESPPPSLMHPAIALRVLRHRLFGKKPSPTPMATQTRAPSLGNA